MDNKGSNKKKIIIVATIIVLIVALVLIFKSCSKDDLKNTSSKGTSDKIAEKIKDEKEDSTNPTKKANTTTSQSSRKSEESKSATLINAPTANTLTYTGSAQALVTVGTASGGTLQYKIAGGSYSTDIPTATDAGEYTVYYKVEGDSSHKSIAEASVKVTISKRKVTLASANTSKIYDGTALADDTVIVGGDRFADGEGATYTVTGSQTSAGTSKNVFDYTLNNGTRADNYEIAKNEGTLTVYKRQLTISGTTVSNKAYDKTTVATAQLGTVGNIVEGDSGKVTVTTSATFVDAKAGQDKDVMVVYAISGVASDNYTKPVDDTLTATISPKKLAMSETQKTVVKNKEYDGGTIATATSGTLNGVISGDTVTVSVTSATFDDASVGTVKPVTVIYELSGADASNYEAPDNQTCAADITKKTLTITPNSDQSKTYDGTTATGIAYTYSGDVSGETPAFTGGLALENYAVNAGIYKIVQDNLALADKDSFNASNYSLSITNDVKYTIKKAAATIDTSDVTKSYTYTGHEQTVNSGATVDSGGALTYTNNTFTNVPTTGKQTVAVSAAETDNYKAASTTVEITINKATTIITNLALDDWTYGEDAKNPSAVTNFGTISYTYSKSESGTYTSTVPTSAGTYYVKAGVEESGNYSAAESKISFNINKATQSISAPTATDENIKTTSITLTSIDAGHGDTTYACNTNSSAPASGWQASTEFTGLTAGTEYYFFAKYAGDDNYIEAVSNGKKIRTAFYKVTIAEPLSTNVKGFKTTEISLSLINGKEESNTLYFDWENDTYVLREGYTKEHYDIYKITCSISGFYITYKTEDGNSTTVEPQVSGVELTSDITITGIGTGECIDENSMITMADGSLKAMKDIEVGDEVLSIDYDTMTLVARKVIYTSKDEEAYDRWIVPSYYKHTFSDGTVIKRAMNHRFYCLEDQSYEYMHTWENGEHTYKIDGTNPSLVSTEIVQEPLHYARITLEGSNNFFANGLATGDRRCCPNKVVLNKKLELAN